MRNTIQHIYKCLENNDRLLYAWFTSMHTRADIILYCPKPENELLLAVEHIYDVLFQLEKTANYYDPDSELAHVNRTASISPVIISQPLYEMIDLCLKYNEKTSGCFDVTIHSDHYNQDTIHSVRLSSGESSVYFQQTGVTINLSGFLKGYALDKIRVLLTTHMIENALINMGNSSILALGNHPVGTGWKVSFESHANAAKSGKNEAILLHDECLTTSGNDSNERRHILSPHNGKLIEGTRQVAAVTENGTIGEILSTSLFVANQEQREALIAEFHPKRIIDY